MTRFRVLVSLSLVLALTACGGGTSDPVEPPPPPPPPITASPDVRADYLVGRMTLDEKIHLVHGGAARDWWAHTLPRGGGGWVPGITRLGIPPLYLADGSVGVGNSVGEATALPSSLASAAAWDLDLAYEYGKVIGTEMRALGINVNLGGNVNLTAREPRGGRTFETKGEDPIFAGRITAAHLKAIQDQHVMAGIKHYAFNDVETGRMSVNVLIDDRAARESDLLAFEIGLKDSGVQSVMCSYNLLNGDYGCENSYLLNTVLKNDWGFKGFVMSDWDATRSTVKAAINGMDQEHPENLYFDTQLKQAVLSGQVSEARLNDMVHRILRAMFAVGIFDYPITVQPIDAQAGAAVAQEVAEQGSVLLKNSGILPLSKSLTSVAVIGSHGDIGVLSGGGSAQVTPVGGVALNEGTPCPPCWSRVIWHPSSPLNAIKAKIPSATVQYNEGTDAASAASLAATSEVAIVFVSQWESEGMDVPSLNFTDVIHTPPIDQDALVNAVAAANPNIIVVLENGGPKFLPWLSNVNAVLEAWYPGQKGGEAIANILFGDVNPSGKLPMTFPAKTSHLPRPVIAQPPDATTPFDVDYNVEGFNVGYKWYDSRDIAPLFEFGFGLSYTTFAINNVQLTADTTSSNHDFQITLDVRNTGTRAGAEVAQVYLELPSGLGESRRLVGWKKISLAVGEKQSVTIAVNANDTSHPLSFWDTGTQSWKIAAGTYIVKVGNSSRNLVTAGTFEVQ
jgi:beta-glucosidase